MLRSATRLHVNHYACLNSFLNFATGAWSEDTRHGQRTYTYVNGDKYEGEWFKNKRNGTGTYLHHISNTRVGDISVKFTSGKIIRVIYGVIYFTET